MGGKVETKTQPATALFVITVDGKNGFIDRTGNVVIEPRFKKAYPFREGLAAVQVGRRWGFIDPRGRMVIEPRFTIRASSPKGWRPFRYEFGQPWGYIDRNGKVVIQPRFDTAGEFRNGLAARRLRNGAQQDPVAAGGRRPAGEAPLHRPQGRVRGRRRRDSTWPEARPTNASCSRRNGRWGYCDADGKVVIPPRFVGALAFSNGRACVRLDGPFGFIDTDGKFVIKPQFQYANSFSEGLAGVPLGAKGWGFIDTDGKVVIPPRFNWIYGGFRQGLAEVS